jgi:hypothetical protein
MKATVILAIVPACAMLLLGAPAARGANDPPPISRYKEIEAEFVTKVGVAIVRAARRVPSKISLSEYRYEKVEGKQGRLDLKITMKWVGLTRKTYTSRIVVKIDASDEPSWEVLNVEYEDDAAGKPNANRIQELIKKFNR